MSHRLTPTFIFIGNLRTYLHFERWLMANEIPVYLRSGRIVDKTKLGSAVSVCVTEPANVARLTRSNVTGKPSVDGAELRDFSAFGTVRDWSLERGRPV